jgi:hypothetical protein
MDVEIVICYSDEPRRVQISIAPVLYSVGPLADPEIVDFR